MSGNNQRIIITGGLGYLGMRLAEYFGQQSEYDVVITSRSKTKLPEELHFCQLAQVNLEREEEVKKLLSKDDVVIHLAAPNEIDAGKDVQLAFQGTVVPTYNLLRVGSAVGIKKLVYFSTFHVYGKATSSIITEDSLPKPNHPYSISHKAAEDFCLSFANSDQVNATVFRLSNAVGRPTTKDITRWTLLVNDLSRQVTDTGKILLKSYGSQLRDFVAIEKIQNAVDFIINTGSKASNGEVYNLGGQVMSVYDMANLVSKSYTSITSKTAVLERSEYGKDQIALPYTYSNAKLEGLGFTSDNGLERAVEGTLHFCMNNPVQAND